LSDLPYPPDIRSLLTYPRCIARRPDASAFTREGDEKVVAAFIAKSPDKAVGEETARGILAKIMFHKRARSSGVTASMACCLIKAVAVFLSLLPRTTPVTRSATRVR
jgi:hypothetical protein